MSDTVKAALIIGVCLMLGLWGAGWLNRIPEEFTIKGQRNRSFKLDLGTLDIQVHGRQAKPTDAAFPVDPPIRIDLD